MSKKRTTFKSLFSKYSYPKLQSLVPAFFVMVVCALFITVRANADPTNYSTGCIRNNGLNKGVLNKLQVGTSPTSPCVSGESQVSFDYGDIQSITAGTGLSGGATQGAATLSIANSGVGTAQLANAAVTVAKISSGTATSGQVLTADGSGGVSYQTPAAGSNIPFVCSNCSITESLASRIRSKNLTNSYLGSSVFSDSVTVDLSNTTFINADFNNTWFASTTDLSNDNFTGAIFESARIGNVDFTNANLTNANFNFVTNNGSNTFSGATWSNTICPDGTNSNSDGNTCIGHGF